MTYFEETQPQASGAISEMMLSSSHACIILFSLVDRTTFLHVEEKWIPNVIAQRGSKFPIILVGTKLDLKSKAKNTAEASRRNFEPSSVPPWNPGKDSGFSIQSVPVEVLFRIFDFLDMKSLSSASLACKDWCEIIKYPYVWKDRSKGCVESSSIASLRKKFKEIVFYTELSLAGDLKKTSKPSKDLLRKAILESAISGRPDKPKVSEADAEEDFLDDD